MGKHKTSFTKSKWLLQFYIYATTILIPNFIFLVSYSTNIFYQRTRFSFMEFKKNEIYIQVALVFGYIYKLYVETVNFFLVTFTQYSQRDLNKCSRNLNRMALFMHMLCILS